MKKSNLFTRSAFVATFFVFTFSGVLAQPFSFKSVKPSLSNWTDHVTTGDFNHDGLKDIVVNQDNKGLTIFLQTKSGFSSPLFISSHTGVTSAGDLNNDGYDDIVVGYGNYIIIYYQDSPAHFKSPVTSFVGTGVDAVTIGDANNDGYNDIAISLWNETNIAIFFGNKSGTLTLKKYQAIQAGYDGIMINKIGSDTKNSVFKRCGQAYGPILQYKIKVNCSLDTMIKFTLSNKSNVPNISGFAIADYYGDGKKRLFGTRDWYGRVNMWNKLTTVADSEIQVTANPQAMVSADLDGDKTDEIITLHAGKNAINILSSKYGIYSFWVDCPNNTQPDALAIADVNNDGKLDILVANTYGRLTVLINTIQKPKDSLWNIHKAGTPGTYKVTFSWNTKFQDSSLIKIWPVNSKKDSIVFIDNKRLTSHSIFLYVKKAGWYYFIIKSRNVYGDSLESKLDSLFISNVNKKAYSQPHYSTFMDLCYKDKGNIQSKFVHSSYAIDLNLWDSTTKYLWISRSQGVLQRYGSQYFLGSDTITKTWRYDLGKKKWTNLTTTNNFPTGKSPEDMRFVVFKGRLLMMTIAGGEIYEMDPGNGKFTKLNTPKLWNLSQYYFPTTDMLSIYGQDSSGTNYMWNTSDVKNWNQTNNVPNFNADANGFVYQNKPMVIGGTNYNKTTYAVVYTSDVWEQKDGTWIKTQGSFSPRSLSQAFQFDETLILYAGIDQNNTVLKDVYTYDGNSFTQNGELSDTMAWNIVNGVIIERQSFSSLFEEKEKIIVVRSGYSDDTAVIGSYTFRSVNGDSYTPISRNNSIADLYGAVHYYFNGNMLLIGGGHRYGSLNTMIQSSPDGQNWKVNTKNHGMGYIYNNAVLTEANGYLYCYISNEIDSNQNEISKEPRLYKSADGISWVYVGKTFPSGNISYGRFCSHKTKLLWFKGFSLDSVFVSSNGGKQWTGYELPSIGWNYKSIQGSVTIADTFVMYALVDDSASNLHGLVLMKTKDFTNWVLTTSNLKQSFDEFAPLVFGNKVLITTYQGNDRLFFRSSVNKNQLDLNGTSKRRNRNSIVGYDEADGLDLFMSTYVFVIPAKTSSSSALSPVFVNYTAPSQSQAVSTVDTVIVSKDVQIEISVYPNPSTDYVTVQTNEPCKVTLCDMQGKLIGQTVYSNGNITLVRGELPSGIYIINVETKGSVKKEKLIFN